VEGQYFYVMQVIRGSVMIHGPYRSEQARDNRFLKVRGGEVHKFDSYSSDPNEAIREFKMEGV